jgi:RHS repeat-associated protein
MVNASGGAIDAHYEYDPYGNSIVATGILAATNPYRFSTKYLDAESNLYYYGYRYYDPNTGRWLSRDPMGDIVFFQQYTKDATFEEVYSLHMESLGPTYVFIGNNPANYIDSFGLAYFALKPLDALGGIWLGPLSDNPIDDFFNTELSHEQLFFEDGKSPANLGFFDTDGGSVREVTETSGYRVTCTGWNDCVMRKAVANTSARPYCLLGAWGKPKFNCQDWAEATREEYRRLIKEPNIIEKCCPTEEEKKK